MYSDSNELIGSTDVDAVAVITPVWTHYELAKAALENGKHVFVEKPFTSNVAQAEELIDLAEKKNLKSWWTTRSCLPVRCGKCSKLIEEGELGKLYYYDSTRVNLGLFQHDLQRDLGSRSARSVDHGLPHPQGCRRPSSATGQAHLNGHEDIAFITVYFPKT